jgi:delta24-sterol reductase
MEELARFTLARGLVPKVTVEFRTITVGGAIAGSALESSSYKHGQFMDTVAWVQVQKGDGSVVTTRKGDTLWCSLSGTYGTMGIVLEAAIECIEAKPMVEVSYFRYDTIDECMEALVTWARKGEEEVDQILRESFDFLEGLDFPREQIGERAISTMMVGKMVQVFHPKIAWTSRAHGGSFYYEHVRDLVVKNVNLEGRPKEVMLLPGEPFHVDLIPIEDYLFRYDLGSFWMARPMAFELSKFWSYLPFTIGLFIGSYRWVRTLTGSLFTTKNLFKMLKLAPQAVVSSRMVVQDLYTPVTNAPEVVKWVRSNIPLTTPIWICPIHACRDQPFAPNYNPDEKFLINCAMYGRVADGRGRAYTKGLEELCRKLKGRKLLYAQNHYMEDEFWGIYDKVDYDRRRRIHKGNNAFPDFFEKSCPTIPPHNDSLSHKIAFLLL